MRWGGVCSVVWAGRLTKPEALTHRRCFLMFLQSPSLFPALQKMLFLLWSTSLRYLYAMLPVHYLIPQTVSHLT